MRLALYITCFILTSNPGVLSSTHFTDEKRRLREVKSPVLDHTARKTQSQDSGPGLPHGSVLSHLPHLPLQQVGFEQMSGVGGRGE